MAKHFHKKLGSDIDHMQELDSQQFGVADYPDYVLSDPIFNTEEPVAVLQCTNRETDEPMNVVLISSFDGVSWWCWLIEHQRFDVMTIDTKSLHQGF